MDKFKFYFFIGTIFILSACGGEKRKTDLTQQSEMDGSPTNTMEANLENTTSSQEDFTTAKTVVDYYIELQKEHNSPFTLIKKGDKYFSVFKENGKAEEAFVDVKNGYIEMNHSYPGGKATDVVCALFRMADKKPVIGVTISEFPNGGAYQTYYFFRPEDSRQLDWSEHTVPIFTAFDFIAEEDGLLPTEELEDAFPVLLELPRAGTDLKVMVYMGKRFSYCQDKASPKDKEFCKAFDRIEKPESILKWNRQSGQFE